ncbi:Integrin-alpha2 domain-containing protein [Aphelenchoides fujianensis]|nr:Integrin-alpha2 domain-containing protein [Aphelenchoides fujianensis]
MRCGYFLCFFLLYRIAAGFNLDVDQPSLSLGPKGSYFGFSLAQHFQNGQPKLLVGAPRAQSSQPGTDQEGALFACSVQPGITRNCRQIPVKYPLETQVTRSPGQLDTDVLHREGRNHQLLGFVVQSTGTRDGGAMACAPLTRYSQNAYTDGACYMLRNDLNHSGIISTCIPLPKKDRHNEYGTCEQGFSAFMDENVVLTGLPGARKWTGGVFGRYTFNVDGFPDSVDRWTMEVNKQQNGIINLLTSHDYLGYSVRYGRFGFWYEEAGRENFTVVSGATRYNQTGAVLFLPFRKKARPEEERLLGLDESGFRLSGRQLGSGFGYSVEVLDLNNDGFDDLIVGAPFEFFFDEDLEYGGAVYVFFSNGKQQAKGDEHLVFREPVILRGNGGLHSQFGLSLAALGNVDSDEKGFEDFAVGAPYADGERGAVFVYHGAQPDRFSSTPAQAIFARNFDNLLGAQPLRTFGAALTGGVDMDGNGYPDLAIGAFESDVAVMLRSRPVVEVHLDHNLNQRYIRINGGGSCPRNFRTFSVQTAVRTSNRNDTAAVLNLSDEPYQCELRIIPFLKGAPPRAVFKQSGTTSVSWPCGRDSVRYEQLRDHEVYVPLSNQDWVNPIRFNFTLRMATRSRRELPPVVRESANFHEFEATFDRKCGDDNDCHTDLSVKPILLNMTRTTNGTYTSKVTERDSIVVRFLVENRRERAFLAKLYVTYNQDELDEPQIANNPTGVDVVQKRNGLAIVALGNPVEEQQQLSFDLSFNLVRGSSERVSTELIFDVLVNSTSIEEYPEDNQWKAEVKLIKEADLQLDGVSRPPIIRFSKGNRRATDEEDIGAQVVHAYTVTNHGPFYAKNVTVTINWPLKLNTPHDEWVLYTLEEPVVRHRGEVRKCSNNRESKAVNPLDIYNDEILKLAYSTYGPLRTSREKVSEHSALSLVILNSTRFSALPQLKPDERQTLERNEPDLRQSSIFDSEYIRTKDVVETSGEKVRIVDINCKDNSAICVPLVCHFDYIGTKESALIEIRARLWNYTFSADYQRIEYIAITSQGVVEVDPQQGIIEDEKNNFAVATTHAYPDRPLQQDKLNIWILILAVIVGLFLLAVLILIAYRCGFFKRKRPQQGLLHQAEYKHQREMYGAQSGNYR